MILKCILLDVSTSEAQNSTWSQGEASPMVDIKRSSLGHAGFPWPPQTADCGAKFFYDGNPEPRVARKCNCDSIYSSYKAQPGKMHTTSYPPFFCLPQLLRGSNSNQTMHNDLFIFIHMGIHIFTVIYAIRTRHSVLLSCKLIIDPLELRFLCFPVLYRVNLEL